MKKVYTLGAGFLITRHAKRLRYFLVVSYGINIFIYYDDEIVTYYCSLCKLNQIKLMQYLYSETKHVLSAIGAAKEMD